MNKLYYVVINGRTLESRNLRLLLARAVAEKRKLGMNLRKSFMGNGYASASVSSNVSTSVSSNDSVCSYGNEYNAAAF
jgi:hypothetical protein